MNRKALLTAVNLSKRITISGAPETHVLKNINLEVQKGQFISISGDPGVGKTTAMYLLAGLDVPSEGQVYFRGEPLDFSTEASLLKYRKRHVGIIYQSPNLVSTLTALENVLLPLDFENISKLDSMWAAEELMDKLNLVHANDQFPDQLSPDELRRVAIARALVKKPELVFADEATAELDPESVMQVISVLSRTCKEAGTAVVFFTRNNAFVDEADVCLRLAAGSLIQSGEVPNVNASFVKTS